jgi:hypothetical protein
MKETYIRPTSPTTFRAIERVGAAPDGPHLKIFRAVIEQDIRLLSKAEDEIEAEAEADEEAEEEKEAEEDETEAEKDKNEAEEDENEDADPRKCVDIGQHPIEYYIYEVWAHKHKRSVTYWIFSAEWSMEDGDYKRWRDEPVTRDEAIEHVAEAFGYEDKDDIDVEPGAFDWSSEAAFPADSDILEYLVENKGEMDAQGWGIAW